MEEKRIFADPLHGLDQEGSQIKCLAFFSKLTLLVTTKRGGKTVEAEQKQEEKEDLDEWVELGDTLPEVTQSIEARPIALAVSLVHGNECRCRLKAEQRGKGAASVKPTQVLGAVAGAH